VQNSSSEPTDLHGYVPDTNPDVLILIDVINHFEYPDGKDLYERALPTAPKIAALKKRARDAKVPTVYVNDNFGRWRSHFGELIEHCLGPETPGHKYVEQLRPDNEDYFVLKPKHSGFYQTPLDVVLKHLGAKRLILTGLTTNSCILFTAHDAYMRDLELCVPCDCVAASTSSAHDYSLRHLSTVVKADISPSDTISFKGSDGR
jgi:nicotinamidase-related amidase